MKTIIQYFTGLLVLALISWLVGITVYYLMCREELLVKLASSVLGGIGTAIGAFIGGALIFRFKAARRFVRRILTLEEDK